MFRAILLCFTLLISFSAFALPPTDSITIQIKAIDTDSARFDWLVNEINKAWLSNPRYTSDLASAFDSLASKTNDEVRMAEALNLNGMAAYANGSYELAADFYLQSLSILEGSTEYQLLGSVLNNLASCYAYRNNNAKSIEYYLQALELARKTQDTSRLAMLNNNLGIQYVEQENYVEAEKYYNSAIDLYRLLEQPLYVGITLLSTANLQIEQEKYTDAIANYNQAMELVPEGMIPLLHAASYAGIGSAYNRMGQKKKGENFLLQSLEKAEAINHIEQLKESHRELSELYESLGGYDRSLYHYKKYTRAKDSLFTNDQDKILMDALTKYESEKKQQENELLKAQNQVTQLQLNGSRRRGLIFGIGLLGFAGFSILLYRLNGRIQRQNKIITQALSEKETLLKEIHHRVKNNLQFISSLLGLQSEHIEDKQALGALQEGQDRVQSMALIHQNLYQEDNLTGVNLKDYFIKLIRGLFDSYNIRKESIELVLDIEDLNLDVDSVIPIGLVVNELVSNSLKYAFQDKQKGQIAVSLQEEMDQLTVQVSDNGSGMSKDIQAKLGNSFGYRLINVFKAQLKADLEIDGSDGTTVTLNIRKYKKAVMSASLSPSS